MYEYQWPGFGLSVSLMLPLVNGRLRSLAAFSVEVFGALVVLLMKITSPSLTFSRLLNCTVSLSLSHAHNWSLTVITF